MALMLLPPPTTWPSAMLKGRLFNRGDGLTGEVEVERSADVVEPDARVRDRWRVVGPSRFDHQDLRARCGQFSGEDRTGRARAHHDEVVPLLYARCVSHF